MILNEFGTMILPKSPVFGVDGRNWKYNIDDVITVTNSTGIDIPVDIEHATELLGTKGKPAPAIGWISKIFKKDDAIFGIIDWLDAGIDYVRNKSYKYLSPVFFVNPEGMITQITSIGLTNQPNLNLKVQNRSINMTENVILPNNEIDLKNFIPRADYEVAINRAKKAEAEIELLNKKIMDEEIEKLINDGVESGIISPVSIDYHKAQCRTAGGIDRFKEFIKLIPPSKVSLNFSGKNLQSGLSDMEKEFCKSFNLSEESYLKHKGN